MGTVAGPVVYKNCRCCTTVRQRDRLACPGRELIDLRRKTQRRRAQRTGWRLSEKWNCGESNAHPREGALEVALKTVVDAEAQSLSDEVARHDPRRHPRCSR